MKLSWDMIGYIAGFIKDPITLEYYAQCCKRTHVVAKGLRENVESEYILNVLSPNSWTKCHFVQTCLHGFQKNENRIIFVMGHNDNNVNMMMNYLINKKVQVMPSTIKIVTFNFDQICRNYLNLISAYSRIREKGKPVIIRITGTEHHTFSAIRRIARDRIGGPDVDTVLDTLDAIIKYVSDRLPLGSLLIAPVRWSSVRPTLSIFREVIVVSVKPSKE